MEQKKQTALVLKYAKRRYDGGPEIDMIRSIERKQAIAKMNQLYQQQLQHEPPLAMGGTPMSAPEREPWPMPMPEPVPQAAPEPCMAGVASSCHNTARDAAEKPGKARHPMSEAFLLGPLEICVGIVGMLTGLLAMMAFSRVRNQSMLTQSHLVFSECLKTFNKGLMDTMTTPLRMVQAMAAQA